MKVNFGYKYLITNISMNPLGMLNTDGWIMDVFWRLQLLFLASTVSFMICCVIWLYRGVQTV